MSTTATTSIKLSQEAKEQLVFMQRLLGAKSMDETVKKWFLETYRELQEKHGTLAWPGPVP